MAAIRTVDLFAGAGGLSLGFKLAGHGFAPELAVEADEAAARTFKRNFGCALHSGRIEDLEHFPHADVVIGGPPCQGFSPLGRDGDEDTRAELNQLWQYYVKVVRQIQPQAFVIENVLEFQRSAQFARLLQLMTEEPALTDYGYDYGILNAVDYGVPQRRLRGIFIAVRGIPEVPWPPPPTHGPDSPTRQPYLTVRDSIADLPAYPDRSDIHVTPSGRQELHIRRNPTGCHSPGTAPYRRAATASTCNATVLTWCPTAG